MQKALNKVFCRSIGICVYSVALTLFLFYNFCHSAPITNPSQDAFSEYFTYSKATELNLRVGPNKRYPIKWVIKNKGEPLRVHAKFAEWLRVSDIDGEGGWVLENMTDVTRKYAVVTASKPVYLKTLPTDRSASILRLENKVRVRLKKCNQNNWCKIHIANTDGWVQANLLWGV